ncbi:MAG: IclR family transcriptional regulator [Halanaerobium sp.]|nr:IclR family transcriptional regulator [Halanaerobium sp.]
MAKNNHSTIIKSVQKSLKILKYIIYASGEVSLAELEEEYGYNQSTIHHLLKTLSLEGFVSQNSRTKRYDIGPELLNIWLMYRKDEDYFMRAYPVLKEIVNKFGETANLFIREDDSLICVIGEESGELLKAHLMLGRNIPLHCTAAGKAFLSRLPEGEVREMFSDGLEKYMENSNTDLNLLLEELEEIRERGYSTEKEEFEKLIHAIGVPILNQSGEPIAAVSVVAPKMRLAEDKMERVGSFLVEKSKEISNKLTGTKY